MLWKTKYSDSCITAVRCAVRKVGLYSGHLEKQYYHVDIFSRQVYNNT